MASPTGTVLIGHVFKTMSDESEALLLAGDDDELLADINIRLAMMAGDVFGDIDGATRHLALAETHPLWRQFALDAALSAGDAEAFREVTSADRELDVRSAQALAEQWLYRFGEPAIAADVARAGLSAAPSSPLADSLRDLRCLALGCAENWTELAAELSSQSHKIRAVAEAAHVLFDHCNDAGGAWELIAVCAGAESGNNEPAFHLTLLAADAADDPVYVADALERRLELCRGDDDAGAEFAAAAFLLAEQMPGQTAVKLLGQLSGLDVDWGARLASMARCRASQQAGDWGDAAATFEELAVTPGAGRFSLAYLRRAAEVTEARLGDRTRSLELWKRVLAREPTDVQASRTIERMMLESAPGELVEHLQSVAKASPSRKATVLRRAAIVAEAQLGDVEQALRLAERSGARTLSRLYRNAGNRDRLSEVYRDMAVSSADERTSSALLFAVGALELCRGREKHGEQALVTASRLSSQDVAALSALAAIYRQSARWPELCTTLERIAAVAISPQTRQSSLNLLGRIRNRELGDSDAARDAYESALAIDPGSTLALEALAQLAERDGRWEEAVELRERAAEHTSEARAVDMMIQIAQIEESERGNEDAALAAYERALGADAGAIMALRGAARIYRRRGRMADYLRMIDAELKHTDNDGRRVELLVERGHCVAGLGRDSAEVLASFRRALELDPDCREALAAIANIASETERWDMVVDAFRGAKQNPSNLATLARGLAHQGEWNEYVSVRKRELELAPTQSARARISRELGAVYERELGDDEAAIDAYRSAVVANPDDVEARRDLARLLEESQRYDELTAALFDEIDSVSEGDVERKVELLLRIGHVQLDHQSDPDAASSSFESVLEVSPGHREALRALEKIFGELGREQELLEVVEARAEMTEDRRDRAPLWRRIGELKEANGDDVGAVDAYVKAFVSDPTDREMFRRLEKLGYQHARWDAVTRLYAAAIDLVENRGEPVYQLADLYARRGHVEHSGMRNPDAAAVSYARAVELDPSNDIVFEAVESILRSQRDWAQMIRMYERRAAALGNTDVGADMFRRAARIASNELKHRAEAAQFYERVLALEPSDDEARDAVEVHYRSAEEWEKLISSLESRIEGLETIDIDIDLIKKLARAYEDGLRDEDRAIAGYRRVLEIVPEELDSLESLSRIYESTERWEEMIEVTERLIGVTADKTAKALLYFKCGSVHETKFDREDRAIACYDAAIKASRTCVPAVHGLRDIYLRRKDWPKVIETLELEVKLWEDAKEKAGVYAQIGRIYAESLNEPERAMRFYESALSTDPDCLPANKALFDHYYSRERWEKAHEVSEVLAQKAMRDGDPQERSDFFRRRGDVERRLGDARAAAESMVIALEIQPTNADALDALGAIARDEPWAYNFPATYYELEKIYKKRDDDALLARVIVANGVMRQREGDLEGAESMYREAIDRAKGDFKVLAALVDYYVDIGDFDSAVEAVDQFLDGHPEGEARVEALMRRAEIHADCQLEDERAIRTLREVIALHEAHPEAHYRLAQQLFLKGEYEDAEAAVTRVIELSAGPGQELSAEKLARFYYYLGLIRDRHGDGRGATSQFRRAHEYDPSYAPSALALARRAAESGDQSGAERLLIDSAHVAIKRDGKLAAVPLQRGLARMMLKAGERDGAIQAYRGILEVGPAADDRCALAEIYAESDLPRAVREVKKVLARDLRHGPAYRLLASYYKRAGEPQRAARVVVAMDMMGYAEEEDREPESELTSVIRTPLRRRLEKRHRDLLITEHARTPMGEVFSAIADDLAIRFAPPALPPGLVPYTEVDAPAFQMAVADMAHLFGVSPDVVVGDGVPNGALVAVHPRAIVAIDRTLISATDPARRFLLGWAFDAIRGRYALLLSLGQKQRTELGKLLNSLLLLDEARPPATKAFFNSLTRSAGELIEQHAGTPPADPESWMDGMLATARRAGLFACDDFAAATWMLAKLGGDSIGGANGTAALGPVIAGEDLIRFYLSDEYNELRRRLTRVSPDSQIAN